MHVTEVAGGHEQSVERRRLEVERSARAQDPGVGIQREQIAVIELNHRSRAAAAISNVSEFAHEWQRHVRLERNRHTR